MVSAEVKKEYITLQGRLQDYSSPHNSKVKSHLKFTELDINASQACHFSEQYTDMKAYGSEWLPSLLSVSESVISQSE